MEQLSSGSLITILTGLAIGLVFGFVLQRGRFCMNSAFRDIIFINDLSLFRAYLLSVVVAIIGANLMEDLGLLISINSETGQIISEELRRQAFVPVANILGGYLFGTGIVLAGGCGSGILYRVGEGLMAAWMAVLGFFLGIAITLHGWLSPIYEWLISIEVEIAGKNNPALWDLVGGGLKIKWIIITFFSLLTLLFVVKGRLFGKPLGRGYYWSTAGLLVGVVAVVAWWLSSYFGGSPRGLSFTNPTKEFFFSLITGSSDAANDPEFNFFGIFKSTWGALYVIGVPLGSYISARNLKEFKWKTPPAEELLTVFLGSIIMGIGAALSGGCNIGHGLTGISTMAISSIVTTIFILLGNWTMVYFKFIKPMKD
jgi:uncharacterized membrane protein YedE/YeeE